MTYMLMLEFLGAGITNADDLYVEMQRLPGQRMIGINRNVLVIDIHYAHHVDAAWRACLKLHADFDLVQATKIGAGNRLDELGIVLAIGFLGADRDFERLATCLSLKGSFEARDDIALPMNVLERPSAVGCINDLPVVTGQCVINGGNSVLSNRHMKGILGSKRRVGHGI